MRTPGQIWYGEMLKDPLWTRKRYEILVRDDFKCTVTGCDGGGLQVDHKKYIAGRKPWEYPNDMLQTLCEVHHQLKTLAEKGWIDNGPQPNYGKMPISAHSPVRPRFKKIEPIKRKTKEEWDAFHAKWGIKVDVTE